LLACLAVPSAPTGPAVGSRWRALGEFAADRRFWLFVASGAALQSSHQLYYGFGTLYWRELGFSDPVIGVLWAEGVVAEIVLFWLSAPLVARIGPLGLMALGGVAGILRWSLLGLMRGWQPQWCYSCCTAALSAPVILGAMYSWRAACRRARRPARSRSTPQSRPARQRPRHAGRRRDLHRYGGQGYLFMALLSAFGLLGVAVLGPCKKSVACARAPTSRIWGIAGPAATA